MPTYTCQCSARYKLPEGSEGRKAKCKKCGVVFTIPAKEVAIAPPEDDDWLLEKSPLPPSLAVAPAPDQSASAVSPQPSDSAYTPEELVAMGRSRSRERPSQGFWSSVGWTFLFFTEPNNLIMLVIISVLYGILPILDFGGCLGLAATCIVYGWLFSYCFKVILEAAGGEERLPTLTATEGWWDDIILPLLKFTGASILALIPAVIFGIIVGLAMQPEDWTDIEPDGPIGVAALSAFLFVWPMVLLVTAIGGLPAVFRVDLIVRTMIRSFPAYLAVCLLVAGTTVLKSQHGDLAAELTTSKQSVAMFWAIGGLLQAYFTIVSMRIIGLYYYHFKDRFAWSWG